MEWPSVLTEERRGSALSRWSPDNMSASEGIGGLEEIGESAPGKSVAAASGKMGTEVHHHGIDDKLSAKLSTSSGGLLAAAAASLLTSPTKKRSMKMLEEMIEEAFLNAPPSVVTSIKAPKRPTDLSSVSHSELQTHPATRLHALTTVYDTSKYASFETDEEHERLNKKNHTLWPTVQASPLQYYQQQQQEQKQQVPPSSTEPVVTKKPSLSSRTSTNVTVSAKHHPTQQPSSAIASNDVSTGGQVVPMYADWLKWVQAPRPRIFSFFPFLQR